MLSEHRVKGDLHPDEQIWEAVGYWILDGNGSVHNYGEAINYGGSTVPQAPAGMVPFPAGQGYWIIDDVGNIGGYGDAPFMGQPSFDCPDDRCTAAIVTPGFLELGYIVLDTKGGIHIYDPRQPDYGHPDFEDCDMVHDVVSTCASDISINDEQGSYYIVQYDGRVWAFGPSATWAGDYSCPPDRPACVSSIAAPVASFGYYVLDENGDLGLFGGATDHGHPTLECDAPDWVCAIDIILTPSGHGYWILGSDGTVHCYGDAERFGKYSGPHGAVAMAVSLL